MIQGAAQQREDFIFREGAAVGGCGVRVEVAHKFADDLGCCAAVTVLLLEGSGVVVPVEAADVAPVDAPLLSACEWVGVELPANLAKELVALVLAVITPHGEPLAAGLLGAVELHLGEVGVVAGAKGQGAVGVVVGAEVTFVDQPVCAVHSTCLVSAGFKGVPCLERHVVRQGAAQQGEDFIFREGAAVRMLS